MRAIPPEWLARAPVAIDEAYRVHAAHISAVAASIAVVMGARERPAGTDSTRLSVGAWIIFASVIPGAASAAAIALLSAAGTAAVAFNVSWQEFSSGFREFVRIGDAGYGLARACVYAVLLKLIAIALLSRAIQANPRRVTRIAGAWLISGAIMAMVDAVLDVLAADPTDAQTGGNVVLQIPTETANKAMHSTALRDASALPRRSAERGSSC